MLEQGSRDLPQPLHLGGASEGGLVAHHGVATAAAVCIAKVPEKVVQALGGGKRPAVTITINGHSGNSRIAIMRGRYLIGLSSANRKAAGVATGDEVEVEVELDVEPRVVIEPTDFADARDADPAARGAHDDCRIAANGSTACHREREEARDTLTTDRCSSGEPARSRVNDRLSNQSLVTSHRQEHPRHRTVRHD